MPKFTDLEGALRSSESDYRIGASTKKAILFGPIAIIGLYLLLLLLPFTRNRALWSLEENHPVEVATFAFALAGGVLGLRLVSRAAERREKFATLLCYALFSAGLLFVAGEEIAWGQHFFGFETPAAWMKVNVQKETTIHNIVGLQRHNELIRMAFGAGGIIGVWLSFIPRFRRIGAPAILLPWLALIFGHALIDLYNDYFPIERRVDFYIQRFSELIEMLISITGLLYVWLNSRMLSAPQKE